MKLLLQILITLVLGIGLGLGAVYVLNRSGMGEVKFQPPPASAPVMHVFFVGNSYTFVNDLPHTVGAVAASDMESPVYIETGMAAEGNATLDDMFNNEGAKAQFKSRHWDYLVMQEHSMQALQPSWFPTMQRGMGNWSDLANNHNTKVLVYETWARKPGSDWYDPSKYPGSNMVNPEQMQTQIDTITNTAAQEIKAVVVPVGDVWASCRAQQGAPQLYAADGTHPSHEGTFLTALLLYHQLTGHNLDHVAYVPEDMPKENAQFLIKCASANVK